jgi:glutamate carboxypeptidase
MAKKQEDLDDGIARMMTLQGEVGGVVFEVTRGVTRPVWEPDQAGTMKIFDLARGLAKDLGFEMQGRSQGGGSDGNFTGAMGIPTLDSLGARGQGLHTLNEHIHVDSLSERGRLMAGLLMNLD